MSVTLREIDYLKKHKDFWKRLFSCVCVYTCVHSCVCFGVSLRSFFYLTAGNFSLPRHWFPHDSDFSPRLDTLQFFDLQSATHGYSLVRQEHRVCCLLYHLRCKEFAGRHTGESIPAPSPISCDTLGTVIEHHETHFPHLPSGENNIFIKSYMEVEPHTAEHMGVSFWATLVLDACDSLDFLYEHVTSCLYIWSICTLSLQ